VCGRQSQDDGFTFPTVLNYYTKGFIKSPCCFQKEVYNAAKNVILELTKVQEKTGRIQDGRRCKTKKDVQEYGNERSLEKPDTSGGIRLRFLRFVREKSGNNGASACALSGSAGRI
jgi:hypothetical protein